MKKRSKAAREPIKGRRRKSPEPKRSNASKAVARSKSSSAGKEAEVARLTRELNEALEQQAATSEVLGIISASPGELERVFQSILENATRICEAKFGTLFRFDGKVLHPVAQVGTPLALIEAQRRLGPHLTTPGGLLDRLIRTKQLVHTADRAADDVPGLAARFGGARSYVGVPMIKDDALIGALIIYRQEVRPFTEKQIALVQNFAAQAVIAIENARLLNELRQRTTDLTERTADLTEALEQQTATSEVLQAISSSFGDLEPVLATMLENAVRICDAKFGNIYRWDGEVLHLLASHNTPPAFAETRKRSPLRPPPETPVGRMLAHKEAFHSADMAAHPGYIDRSDPGSIAAVELGGVRTILAIPMLKENELIGSFSVYRQEVHPFTDKQIALVTSFASQAVIAIENARLLNELRQRTDDLTERTSNLTEALEQQTATSEVLQVISSTPGDLQPVFATMLENAVRICDATFGNIYRWDGEALHMLASHNTPPAFAEDRRRSEKQLESHRREITALFCDLRGFTGFTESADAEDVMALLRDYHATVGEKIIKYSGTLERYAGDGVMVVFNDPVPVENPALQAVLMALEVRDAIGALTATWSRLGHEIGFGIGIAHGFATLGTIGFEGRFDYAAIGTVSNVASRLCDEAKPGQILISPRVLTKVESAVTVEPVGEFELKGIRRPLAAYNVLAANLESRATNANTV